ncbi:MAG: hypothetical protein Q9M28_01960 [Mariprofundaceae bacterium]|nr:hypothetical protein [Mariprofundaceae bacterium]
MIPQFIKNIFANGMRHRYITISDGYSSNTIHRVSVSPFLLIILVIIISLFLSVMGYTFAKNNTIEKSTVIVQKWLDRSLGEYNPFPAPPIIKKKHTATAEDILKRCLSNQSIFKDSVQNLTHELQEAETSAQLSLGKMDVLQRENNQRQADIAELNAQIQMFTELLKPQKTKGTKLLKTVFKQKSTKNIDYEITLAKGGNYPRISRGRLLFTGIDSEGHTIKLNLIDDSKAQNYNIETHAFLRGTLKWTKDVVLHKIQVTHQRKKGKKYVQYEKTETEIIGVDHGIR